MLEYLIKWKNYDDSEDNTWEPADDLEVADELIQIFETETMVKKKKQFSKVVDEKKEKESQSANMKKIKTKKAEEKKYNLNCKKLEPELQQEESKPVSPFLYSFILYLVFNFT